MELILQSQLEHQKKAITAVSMVFDGVSLAPSQSYYDNPLISLNKGKLSSNIDAAQDYTEVHYSQRTHNAINDRLNLDIKMETGTGKTYVYTNTMYELHKLCGISKFIVIVPTIPIKAGAIDFLTDNYVQKHFADTCGYNVDLDVFVLQPLKKKKGRQFFPGPVRDFFEAPVKNSKTISVLIVNAGLITSGNLLSRSDYDFGVGGYYRPYDAIRATKPVVLIDEPHKFIRSNTAYKRIIEEIDPQCIIRYGATFPSVTTGRGKGKITRTDYENLIYNLNACSAFNQNLIKGVAKEHFEPTSSKEEKIKITSIEKGKEVGLLYRKNSSSTSFSLSEGDHLGVICSELEGLYIEEIDADIVRLSNGQEKQKGEEFEVSIYSPSYQEQMIKLALRRHFETERQNFERPIRIKTLALFFIDSIESFRGDENGHGAWLRDAFDRLLVERITEELQVDETTEEYKAYLEESLKDISACRAGYFAQDNSDSDTDIAEEVDDILHNKKELLSFTKNDGSINTRRFLFSKWTLKEGWDNPNVFTIAKLRSSGSEISKLQEVGRGLRLPVDEHGNRISNEEFLLNYIIDFTERDFAEKLVREINSDIPAVDLTSLTSEQIARVAKIRSIDANALMVELVSKKYVNFDRSINQDSISNFFAEYPEFAPSTAVSGAKIRDVNKEKQNMVKIRPAKFDEIKTLWAELNKKYILFYDSSVDKLVETGFATILKPELFTLSTLRSTRTKVDADQYSASTVEMSGVEYLVRGKSLSYSEFLRRLTASISVPIPVIHKALVEYAKLHTDFTSDCLNEDSLTRIVNAFYDWKADNLKGLFKYKKANYSSKSTSLTDKNGNVKPEIVQGLIGIHLDSSPASSKYLYDKVAYDSPLERTNIMSEIDEVIVYGKIPRKSISIPTIANSSYSPDFMYVVKKKDGEKELNIVIETKDVENETDLRSVEKLKISCAKEFFDQLKIDGYSVKYKTQLRSESIVSILGELMK